MLRLKVLGARILGGSATRRFQPLCMPFSSSHWYSKVAKASSNDELSEVRGLSSSLDHYALTQPEFLRRQTNKIYVKHTVYKGEGALTMKPKLPDYITLNMGGVTVAKEGCMFLEFAPAVGPRQYDWSKKKIIALSVVEVGTLLSLGPDESCEFTHDPFMGKSEAGKIMKVLKVGNLQDTGGYFFNLILGLINLSVELDLVYDKNNDANQVWDSLYTLFGIVNATQINRLTKLSNLKMVDFATVEEHISRFKNLKAYSLTNGCKCLKILLNKQLEMMISLKIRLVILSWLCTLFCGPPILKN